MARIRSSRATTATGNHLATSKASTPRQVAQKQSSNVAKARPYRKARPVGAKLLGKAPEPGTPYQAWEELDPAIFPDYARGAIAKKPLPPPGPKVEEDWLAGADSDEDMSSKNNNEDGSSSLLNLARMQVDPETRLHAPRVAAPRKITADPTNEVDKTILKMKIEGFTDRQVADRIRDMPGGVDYNIKTIATRYKRLQVAAAKKREEEFDAWTADWHDGDDEALLKAKAKAEKEIRKQQKELEEVHMWKLVAQYLKQAKPASSYSQNACRKRIEAISKVFAAAPPGLEDDSLANAIIRQNHENIKAVKGYSDEDAHRILQMVEKELNTKAHYPQSPSAQGFHDIHDSDATIEDSVLTGVDALEDVDADADDEAGPLEEEEDTPIKRAVVPPASKPISIRNTSRPITYISSTTEESNDDADCEITSDQSSPSESDLAAHDTPDDMAKSTNPAAGRTAEEQAEMDKQREYQEWEVKIALGMVAIEDTPLYDGHSRIPPFKPAVLPFYEGVMKTKYGVYHGFPAGYHEMVKESLARAAIAHEEAKDPEKERAAMALQFVPNRGPNAVKDPQQPIVPSENLATPPSLPISARPIKAMRRVSKVGSGEASTKKHNLSNNGKEATNATKNNQASIPPMLAGSVTEMSRAEQEFARAHLSRLLLTDKKIRDDPKAWDAYLFKGLGEMTSKWIAKMKAEVDPNWSLSRAGYDKWFEYTKTTFPELFDYDRPI